MNAVMTERIRLIIDTDEDVRLAVKLAASKADLSVSDLINKVLRERFAEEIRDARKYIPKKKPDKSPKTKDGNDE